MTTDTTFTCSLLNTSAPHTCVYCDLFPPCGIPWPATRPVFVNEVQ